MNGNDLIAFGFRPGKNFGEMLIEGEYLQIEGLSREEIADYLRVNYPEPPPFIPLQEPNSVPFRSFLQVNNQDEADNFNAVQATMNVLMRTPGVKAAAVMPDACPAGPLGTIPVGGVVASENIHPGMHSADVCCSMACTVMEFGVEPIYLLNAIHEVTHFGYGVNPLVGQHALPAELEERILGNPLLKDLLQLAKNGLGTQGDGNHFASVGTMQSSGRTALVTHHGSRGFGARLYKIGMKIAERYRRQLSPDTLPQNAWIPFHSEDGQNYWKALKIVKDWTLCNHQLLHQFAAERANAEPMRFMWNAHNFVFMREDMLLYHAKGATPSYASYEDYGNPKLIPMNMNEPILLTMPTNNPEALGFAPHGAGRNYSRTEHQRRNSHLTKAELFRTETAGIDARFFSGEVDISELPSAYKSAATVQRVMTDHNLAVVVDRIIPFGCIMAGEIKQHWRK